MATRSAALVASNGNGNHLYLVESTLEHRQADWGVKDDIPVWTQDVVSCSSSEWDVIKHDVVYVGWHVCYFEQSVVALSPVRIAGQ